MPAAMVYEPSTLPLQRPLPIALVRPIWRLQRPGRASAQQQSRSSFIPLANTQALLRNSVPQAPRTLHGIAVVERDDDMPTDC